MKQKDIFNNFSELKKSKLGRKISIKKNPSINNSKVLIFTPHGGGIEPGTSEIVKEAAGKKYNYYCFEGNGQGCKRMHITSHKFDEPQLLHSIKKYAEAVSIHGMNDREDCDIYVGGLNNARIKKVTLELRKAGYKVLSKLEKSIAGLAANENTNVTNKCKSKKGTQIEISDSLRAQCFQGDYKKKDGRKNKSKEFFKLCRILENALN